MYAKELSNLIIQKTKFHIFKGVEIKWNLLLSLYSLQFCSDFFAFFLLVTLAKSVMFEVTKYVLLPLVSWSNGLFSVVMQPCFHPQVPNKVSNLMLCTVEIRCQYVFTSNKFFWRTDSYPQLFNYLRERNRRKYCSGKYTCS